MNEDITQPQTNHGSISNFPSIPLSTVLKTVNLLSLSVDLPILDELCIQNQYVAF